jgi:hypothetical protein
MNMTAAQSLCLVMSGLSFILAIYYLRETNAILSFILFLLALGFFSLHSTIMLEEKTKEKASA